MATMDESALSVTSGPPEKLVYAVGVRLRYCDCDKFHVPPGSIVAAESHVSISRKVIEVGKSRSAAISYAWGQFQRQSILIGHLSDEGQSERPIPVTVELGKEWEHAAFIEKLVYWSNRYHSIWMDQLCISQEEDNVLRDVLASIPAVFRNLDMLLFRPGPRCKCLEAWMERGDSDEHLLTVALACFNAVDLCSHFDRMWTIQEFRCSRNARVVPVSPRVLPCFRITDRVEDDSLNPFIRLCIEERRNRLPNSFEDVQLYVKSKIRSFVDGIVNNYHSIYKVVTVVNEFLIASLWIADEALEMARPEEQLESKSKGVASSTVAITEAETAIEGHLEADAKFEQSNANLEQENVSTHKEHQQNSLSTASNIVFNLIGVTGPNVKATQPKDYVLSLWVDCPGYAIPTEYKAMSLPSLYEDAIEQYECNFRARLLSLTPNGLFGSNLPSSGLRPKLFFKEFDIKSADDVYGVISMFSMPASISPTGHLRFCTAKNGGKPLLPKACLWTDSILGSTTTEGLAFLEDIVRQWAEVIARGAEPRVKDPGSWDDEFFDRVKENLLLVPLLETLPSRARQISSSVAMEPQNSKNNFNHYGTPSFHFRPGVIAPLIEFLARLVLDTEIGNKRFATMLANLPPSICLDVAVKLAEAALGMQTGTCARHGLVPVATRDDLGVPLLGLFRPDALHLGLNAPERMQTLTLSGRFGGGSISLGPIYEAVRITEEEDFPRDVGDEHLPHYKVCGVWVPTKDQTGLSAAKIADQDEGGNQSKYDMIVV